MVLKMKILSVESSAASCSVALSDNGVLIGEEFTNVKLTHSETLMPMVKNILDNTKTDIGAVDVFAVSNGPGSFTGIRIGVAAVKGMADGVGKPCYGISTLETIAYPFFDRNCVVCSLMDARCSQVYTALFENGKRLTPDSAMLISELADSLKSIDKPIVFAGDGAAVTTKSFRATLTISYWRMHKTGISAHQALHFLLKNISIQVNYRLVPMSFYRFI